MQQPGHHLAQQAKAVELRDVVEHVHGGGVLGRRQRVVEQAAAGTALRHVSRRCHAALGALQVLQLVGRLRALHLCHQPRLHQLPVVRLPALRHAAQPLLVLDVGVPADVQVAAVVAVGADDVAQHKAEAWLPEGRRLAELLAVHHAQEVLAHEGHLVLHASVKRHDGAHAAHKRKRRRSKLLRRQMAAGALREHVARLVHACAHLLLDGAHVLHHARRKHLVHLPPQKICLQHLLALALCRRLRAPLARAWLGSILRVHPRSDHKLGDDQPEGVLQRGRQVVLDVPLVHVAVTAWLRGRLALGLVRCLGAHIGRHVSQHTGVVPLVAVQQRVPVADGRQLQPLEQLLARQRLHEVLGVADSRGKVVLAGADGDRAKIGRHNSGAQPAHLRHQLQEALLHGVVQRLL
mmetsp:Transcript_37298/g.95338  ORF Transcript_37298/g.95338 Transcript_37298/m.95338 type:complete len:407 (-) Transcript_37298:1601-2821(-)